MDDFNPFILNFIRAFTTSKCDIKMFVSITIYKSFLIKSSLLYSFEDKGWLLVDGCFSV